MKNNIIIIAKNLLQDSTENYPMCAIIHKKNTILATGLNQSNKTHPLSQRTTYNAGIHAELAAILKVRYRDLTNCEITVVRVSKEDGSLRMAKPCRHCQILIKAFGIQKVNYSNEFGNITSIRMKRI
jgi:deoxycytidylate deaminase